MLAEVRLLREDVAAAEASLHSATDIEGAHDDRYFSAEVLRILAACRRKQGAEPVAQDWLRKALEVPRTQGASLSSFAPRWIWWRSALTRA